MSELTTKIKISGKSSAKTTVTPKKVKQVASSQKNTGKQAKVVVEEKDPFPRGQAHVETGRKEQVLLSLKRLRYRKQLAGVRWKDCVKSLKHRFDLLKFNKYSLFLTQRPMIIKGWMRICL